MNLKTSFYFAAVGMCLVGTACRVNMNRNPEPSQRIIVPSSFTPNDDGVDDTWQIQNLQDYENVKVRIYNRFGEIAYESNGAYRPWNGNFKNSPVPPGEYFYTIDIGRRSRNPNGWVIIRR